MLYNKFQNLLCFFVFTSFSFSQTDKDYSSLLVPLELKSNANAVVRFDKQVVQIDAFDKIIVTTKRVVTVFNDYGDRHQNAYEGYDENTKIKNIEARIFDAFGKEIKKIKERDFVDESAVSGGTLYSDSRVKYLNYTPVKYPYTLEYTSEVEMRSTGFIPKWKPIDDYYLAVEYSEFQVINNSGVELKTKAKNFKKNNIIVENGLFFSANNLNAVKNEAYSSGLLSVVPELIIALNKFAIDGVDGINRNWKDQGKWMYQELLKDKLDLSQNTKNMIQTMVKDVEDPIEKAKIVYKYVQSNTRYISVQEGIGGMQPASASDVDNLKYGDCKGLSNYTKALLDAVGVESYYTRLYASENLKNVDKEFVTFQGQTNHVILALPVQEDYVWLECTSQTNPFGFIAGFTDDRDVLVVKPEGGEIVHTKVYNEEDSQQITKSNIILDQTGSFTADVTIKTTGYQYNLHKSSVNTSRREQELYYKEYWDNINNLDIKSIELNNNKDDVELTENVVLSAGNYASKSGKRLILQPNIFNKVKSLPPRYENRNLDFKLQRAYKDVDEFIIQLPENIKVEAMSKGETIETKFGTYKFNIEEIEGNKLKYSREYIMFKGDFSKEDYAEFRNFSKQIVKLDKIKIVLLKN